MIFYFFFRLGAVSKKHVHTHTVTANKRAREKNSALRQLAEGQPAKGVGERHTYAEREWENKG